MVILNPIQIKAFNIFFFVSATLGCMRLPHQGQNSPWMMSDEFELQRVAQIITFGIYQSSWPRDCLPGCWDLWFEINDSKLTSLDVRVTISMCDFLAQTYHKLLRRIRQRQLYPDKTLEKKFPSSLIRMETKRFSLPKIIEE
jgi:hypothetical protein